VKELKLDEKFDFFMKSSTYKDIAPETDFVPDDRYLR
jgi:hypothetical protein